MKTHRLKTWTEYYNEVIESRKKFEVRLNDRDYKLGDFLLLEEWDKEDEDYTGRKELYKVTFILYGGSFGIDEKHCVMSIQKV